MTEVTATDFRRNLFRLLDKVGDGEPLVVKRGGQAFTVRLARSATPPSCAEASWPIQPTSKKLRRYFEMVPETEGPGLSVDEHHMEELATLNEDEAHFYEP
jgi:hypothetical protein